MTIKKLFSAAVSAVFIAIPAYAEMPADVTQPSLFFTQDQMEQIYQANDGILDIDPNQNPQEQITAPVDPGPRVLKLAGILYHGDKDWVIWFNGTRVTPGHLPEHMMDVLVRSDRVAIKWMDKGTNKIINLVMHPHQEYHIDTDTITLGTN